MENCKLKSEVFKLRGDVYDLKDRMNSVENKSLENNLIFHGILDSENEYLNQLVDKLQRNFADTIDIYDDDARIQRARGIHIARCKRLSQYQDNRCRPIRVEFVYKWDADELYENRFYLSRGIYIKRDYNEQTENARRLLRPILKASKQYSEYKTGSRLDGDKLVINGKRYGKNNLHQLPDKLKPMKVATRRIRTQLVFLESFVHSVTFTALSSSTTDIFIIVRSNTFNIKRPSIAATLLQLMT